MHYKNNARAVTTKLLDLIEEGALDPTFLAQCCLSYMSEDEVADMAQTNGILDEEDVEDDGDDEPSDDMDGDHESALASAGFGTDEDYGYYGDE